MTQFAPKTRMAIRQHIGLLMDKLTLGLAVGGTQTSVTLEAVKRYPDQHFAGRVAFPVTGAAVGQQRVITQSLQTDGILFVEPPWTVALAAGDMIEVWDEDLHPDRVNNAINLAILDTAEFADVEVRVSPEVISSDRLELTLPDEVTKIAGVGVYRPGQPAVVYQQVDPLWPQEHPNGWTTVGHTVFISPALGSSVLPTDVQLIGYRAPRELSADSELCEVRPDYLIYLAAFFLESGEMGSQVVDPTQHGPRAAAWLRQALMIRERMYTSFLPNTVAVGP